MNPPPKTAAKPEPRAYSYLRFSTPEQSKGDSLRRQTALADEYAQRHGLTLDNELSLRDLGVSAFRGNNAAVGALGAFRRAIEQGLVPRGSVLLVESLDRISRQSARKAVRILEEIVEGGVDVVTLNDGKRYTEESLDGTDFLMAILLFMRGAEESATKAKRIRAAWHGKRLKAAQREVITTRAPAWLRAEGSAAKDARNARFTLIPERGALIRRMFAMFLDGTGKKGIAQALNVDKVPTWGAGKGRAPAPYWHGTYVYKILTNPAVTGVFTPHVDEYRDGHTVRVPQQPIPDYYPRVIDDEMFERTQTLMRARSKTVRRAGIASLVAGVALCPKCGSTMTRVNKGEKDTKPKLVCVRAKSKKRRGEHPACQYHGVRVEDVERALIDNADKLRRPPLGDSNLTDSIEGMSSELVELEHQIDSVVDAIEKSPSAALSKRLAAREAEALTLRGELDALRAKAADSESNVVKHRAARLADALKQLKADPTKVAAANAALREAINSITVDYLTGELRLNWRHGVGSTLYYAPATDVKARRGPRRAA